MRKLLSILFLTCVPWVTPFAATSTTANNDLTPAEKTFLQAETALNNDNLKAFNEFSNQLQTYPLYPYLQYAALMKRLGNASPTEVEKFLITYGNTPLAERLRTEWLLLLGEKKDWAQLVKFYSPALSSTKLQCLYLHGLIETGRRQDAFPQIQQLWLSAYKQPDTCGPVFSAWIASGHLTQQLVHERFRLALQKHQLAVATSLLPYFATNERDIAQLWLSVYKNPTQITQQKFLTDVAPHHKPLLAYGVTRLAQKEPDTVIKIWPQLVSTYQLSPQLQQEVLRSVGTTFALKGRPEALSWLSQVSPAFTDEKTQMWRIRSALDQGDWDAVNHWISQLTPEQQNQPVWRYWQARADAKLGKTQSATAIYQTLTSLQDYYGFLASYQLKQAHPIQSTTVQASAQALQQIEQIPGVQRARELLKLQRYADARREWQMVTLGLNQDQLATAAVLAARWQWYDRSLKTAEMANKAHDLTLAFPMGYKQQVELAARAEHMDPAWLFAIIRQESAFMADVASYVGALGLMQLMPGTATDISRTLNMPFKHTLAILNADLNVRFGSHYLKKMYTKNDNNPTLATASYNAGPGAIKRWLPTGTKIEPADIWIETIPFTETRGYVKNVMVFTMIYQKKLGQKPDIKPWLAPITSKG